MTEGAGVEEGASVEEGAGVEEVSLFYTGTLCLPAFSKFFHFFPLTRRNGVDDEVPV